MKSSGEFFFFFCKYVKLSLFKAETGNDTSVGISAYQASLAEGHR